MALNTLSILLQTDNSAKDTLAEQYGKVIENFSKGTISSMYKNTDLSGDPTAGIVNAKRFANATAKTYGTARTNVRGEKIEALPVPVAISDKDEFIEEVEEADLAMYGVDGLISRRVQNQFDGMKRLYERRFFRSGYLSGTPITLTGATIEAKLEEVIQELETVQNDFVDGIDRANMCLVLNPATYGLARNAIDKFPVANVNSGVGEFGIFHGVMTHSSVYLPATVEYLIFVKGAIAQPIKQSIYNPAKIQLSDATAFGMFLYSGTVTVTPDLVFFAGTLGTVTATSTDGAAGETTKTVMTVTSAKRDAANDFYYLSGASAVTAPAYGDAVGATWTKLVLTEGSQKITTGTDTKIRIAEANASGKIIAVSAEITIEYVGA